MIFRSLCCWYNIFKVESNNIVFSSLGVNTANWKPQDIGILYREKAQEDAEYRKQQTPYKQHTDRDAFWSADARATAYVVFVASATVVVAAAAVVVVCCLLMLKFFSWTFLFYVKTRRDFLWRKDLSLKQTQSLSFQKRSFQTKSLFSFKNTLVPENNSAAASANRHCIVCLRGFHCGCCCSSCCQIASPAFLQSSSRIQSPHTLRIWMVPWEGSPLCSSGILQKPPQTIKHFENLLQRTLMFFRIPAEIVQKNIRRAFVLEPTFLWTCSDCSGFYCCCRRSCYLSMSSKSSRHHTMLSQQKRKPKQRHKNSVPRGQFETIPCIVCKRFLHVPEPVVTAPWPRFRPVTSNKCFFSFCSP